MKKARALLGPLSLLVATAFGCTVIAEVDRDKIPDEGSAGAPDTSGGSGGSGEPGSGGEGAASEGGAGGAGGESGAVSSGGEGGGSSGEGGSSGGPACDLGDHSGCGVTELCCEVGTTPTCVEGSLGECTACGQKCEDGTADACGERECTCGDGPACTGSTPYCTEQGCAACRTDADCGGSETQCVDGVCEACDTAGNAGCTDSTKPICNSSHVCEKCSGNCAGDLVCDISGACTGCDDHDDCAATASTPICDETSISGIFQCRACVNDGDCVSELGLAQCFNGQCAPCDPHDHAGCSGTTPLCNEGANEVFSCVACTDQFCLEESPAAPVCAKSGTSSGMCVVCDATHTSACPEATPHCLAASNTCVECTAHADCTDPTKPLCSPTTHACVPCTNAAVSSGADAACDDKLDGSRCVESGPLAGRCGACDPQGNQGCSAPSPQCLESNATCVQCVGNTDCASVNGKPLCNTASHTCVECLNDTSCGAKVCSSGSCVACGADPDCQNHPGATFCTADGCKACDPDGDAGCALGLFCSAANYSCVECLEQSDCGSEVCSSGVCSPCVAASNDCVGHPSGAVCATLPGGGTACAACDPATEQGCSAQQCVSVAGVPTCKLCDPATNAGCPLNDTCDAQTYTCVPPPP